MLDCGSCAEIGKAASGSPTVISAAENFHSESDKEGAKCSVEQTAVADSNASKALSASRDSKQNDNDATCAIKWSAMVMWIPVL